MFFSENVSHLSPKRGVHISCKLSSTVCMKFANILIKPIKEKKINVEVSANSHKLNKALFFFFFLH